MADHKINLGDNTAADDPVAIEAIVRKPYKVLAETGLFKNGNQYNQGATIELDDKTAANFIAVGEIEPIEGEV